MGSLRFLGMATIIALFSTTISAQTYETEYEAKIKEYTTDARFIGSSVERIPDHPTIPSPLDHFGTIIGEPGVMHTTTQIYEYFQVLANASPNLVMEKVRSSEEGRPIYLITISDEATITNIDDYKAMLAKLSDPRTTSKEEAEKIAKNGKPVYYLNGGMHSIEMGSPEMLMELAYRLIADPSDDILKILKETIVLINPVSEPDGRDKQVDWYYAYTKGRTDWNDGFRRTPPYWGQYVFHDNNRDGLQISQAITKAIFDIYFEWHPTVMLDLHESVPLLYISTGTGPYNENVDPITIGEWQTIANHEMTTLAAQGMPGVFNWAFYDGWWPGYGIWVANNHNSIGRFYETFGNAGADTYLRDISRSRYAGDPATSREWYRPEPPAGNIWWSARNNTNYMQAGVLASLHYAADNATTLLRNFYQKSVNNTKTGETGDIKMFHIPADQRDPAMTAYLLNQLQRQGIEVHQAENGDYAVLLNQPYSKFAVDLLTEQKYPQDAKFPPYDAIAWTLGYMYGVDVTAVDSMHFSNDELTLITDPITYQGSVAGDGNMFAINYEAESSVISALYDAENKYRRFKATVIDEELIINEDTLAAGSVLLSGLNANDANALASAHGLDLIAGEFDTNAGRLITLPKIAVYHSWFDTQAEGWARYTLEQKGIPYTSIDKDDLKAGNLNRKFDVILIPHLRGDASSFVNGFDDSFGPIAYTKTDETPSFGTPDASDDITGGPGFEGIAHLKEFVEQGGVLVPLANASRMIAELGISPKVSAFNPSGLFHPGSIVTVQKNNDSSPILYGYPETFHVFKGNGYLLNTNRRDREMKVLQFGTEPLSDEKPYNGETWGKPLDDSMAESEALEMNKEQKKEKTPPYVRSGMVRNQQAIIGHAAIMNAPVGEGNVVYFTFNPLNRFLNHHDSSLLWNVLINWDALE
ncbi:MAG: M14 family zinc carboxypeptidase [bacterium]|nr:M14 family zinc carboxypeptidase [bacterium]